MEASNKTTATKAKSLISEVLPVFENNDNQFARRANIDATRANNTSDETITGEENTNSTVNTTSMYSVFSNPSSNLDVYSIDDKRTSIDAAPPTHATIDLLPSTTTSTLPTPYKGTTSQQQTSKCILVPPSSTSTTAITDSGCTYHMTGDKSLFTELHLYDSSNETPPTVTLGDDKHTIQASGWGIIEILKTKREFIALPSSSQTLDP